MSTTYLLRGKLLSIINGGLHCWLLISQSCEKEALVVCNKVCLWRQSKKTNFVFWTTKSVANDKICLPDNKVCRGRQSLSLTTMLVVSDEPKYRQWYYTVMSLKIWTKSGEKNVLYETCNWHFKTSTLILHRKYTFSLFSIFVLWAARQQGEENRCNEMNELETGEVEGSIGETSNRNML